MQLHTYNSPTELSTQADSAGALDAPACMSRKLQDVFFKKAKAEGYLARSAYKLLELQKQHRIIPSGATGPKAFPQRCHRSVSVPLADSSFFADGNVLDLGCSPGAWLQVAAESTSGQIVGIDLKVRL